MTERADFEALRSRRRDTDVILFAFDLIELQGKDWRHRQLGERKTRLASLLARRSDGIQFTEHLEHDGELAQACRIGARGHRVKADRCALAKRALKGVAEVEEPGQRSRAARARGRLGLKKP